MPLLTVTTQPDQNSRSSADAELHSHSTAEPSAASNLWNITTYIALAMLVAIWAAEFYFTWGAWGNVTIDSGHEMYIPALLSEGKVLYRDVWFPYGPGAPYFNSYLFRIFGVHLNVLYWAGSLSALGSALFLFLTGMRLSAWHLGWTAAAVVLLQAFQPSLFCFPLPYSFAAVYGCLLACFFVWLATVAVTARSSLWMLAAGTTAAVALVVKPEFGTACYGAVALLIVLRAYLQKSWPRILQDALALLPGVIFCGLVIAWMISIAGADFITQENLVSWPSSYFMKTYGKMWLERNGFTVSLVAFKDALVRTVPLAAILLTSYVFLWWKNATPRANLLRAVLTLATVLYFARLGYFASSGLFLTALFFPRHMVLYVSLAVPVAWLLYWAKRHHEELRMARIALLLTFSALLSFRILMKMMPKEYPIFYNGPVVLSFLLLMVLAIPRAGRPRRFVFLGQLIICLGCLSAVALSTIGAQSQARDFVPLVTERGTIRLPPKFAERYAAAINFMKEKSAQGELVLSVPEDTSLYFLSGTYSPMRVFSFTPGIVAPGIMTEKAIHEIESKPVRYLLWSNRVFPEFGVPVFGKNFNQEIGAYLQSRYHRVGYIWPNRTRLGEWTAVVWERNAEPAPQ